MKYAEVAANVLLLKLPIVTPEQLKSLTTFAETVEKAHHILNKMKEGKDQIIRINRPSVSFLIRQWARLQKLPEVINMFPRHKVDYVRVRQVEQWQQLVKIMPVLTIERENDNLKSTVHFLEEDVHTQYLSEKDEITEFLNEWNMSLYG
jgi:hypothetical protein